MSSRTAFLQAREAEHTVNAQRLCSEVLAAGAARRCAPFIDTGSRERCLHRNGTMADQLADRKDPVEARFERILADSSLGDLTLIEWIETAERWRICQALRECRGNRSAAARCLGIGRRTLYTKMERLGIDKPRRPPPR